MYNGMFYYDSFNNTQDLLEKKELKTYGTDATRRKVYVSYVSGIYLLTI